MQPNKFLALFALALALILSCASQALANVCSGGSNLVCTAVAALVSPTATTYAIPMSTATTIGDAIIVIMYNDGQPSSNSFTVSDNAGTGSGNCGGAYTINAIARNASGEYVIASCLASTIQLGTGTTCGAGGTTQCAITVTTTSTANKAAIGVIEVSGLAAANAYDKSGTAETITPAWSSSPYPWTAANAAPSPSVSDELLIGVSAWQTTSSTDAMSSPTGGYSIAVSTPYTGSSLPMLYVFAQEFASGNPLLGGTLSSTAARTLYSNTFEYKAAVVSGAVCITTLTGAGAC